MFATCGSQKRIVERDELHTREGATETTIGSVSLGVFDSSVAGGHQLCTGTPVVCLFGWARLLGGLREYKSVGGGPVVGLSAACVLGGPGPGDHLSESSGENTWVVEFRSFVN